MRQKRKKPKNKQKEWKEEESKHSTFRECCAIFDYITKLFKIEWWSYEARIALWKQILQTLHTHTHVRHVCVCVCSSVGLVYRVVYAGIRRL